MSQGYPWFQTIHDDSLEQGDIFENCPVFMPPEDLAENPLFDAIFTWEERDVIVLSQTCDMVRGREKITEALLCPLWKRSEITEGYLSTSKGMEEARRGSLPGFHLLAESSLPEMPREVRTVDFRRVHSLPLSFLRRRAIVERKRLRLLPPYREHLSQAFARFFMRVGLPADIPPFR